MWSAVGEGRQVLLGEVALDGLKVQSVALLLGLAEVDDGVEQVHALLVLQGRLELLDLVVQDELIFLLGELLVVLVALVAAVRVLHHSGPCTLRLEVREDRVHKVQAQLPLVARRELGRDLLLGHRLCLFLYAVETLVGGHFVVRRTLLLKELVEVVGRRHFLLLEEVVALLL